MKRTTAIFLSFIVIAVFLSTTPVKAKPIERSLCVFDVIGTNGPVFNSIKRYRTAALEWGVKFNLKPYTDEAVAMEDFQSKECDGVVMTGVRTRRLVKFTGSIDMMGALPTYDHLKKAIGALTQPKAKKYVRTKKFEVAGIFPAGAVYFFVRPETMRKLEGTPTVDDLAGKKVAVMSYDKQGMTSIRQVGATPVPSDLTNFSGKFNNGSVDIIYAPASAYNALELYRGLGEDGRVIDYPLANVTYQITLRRDNFSEEFGQKSREWAFSKFDEAKQRIMEVTNEIPDGKWVDIPDKRVPKYRAMFRRVRQQLKKRGVYDPRTMTLLRNIRCNIDPTRAECTMDSSES